MAKFIILCSKSAAGKDSIQSALLDSIPYLKPIISSTSRPKRENEVEGREYHFLSQKEMEDLLYSDKLIESRTYDVENGDTWIYGVADTAIDLETDNIYVGILDIRGLHQFTSYVGKDNVISFYIDASAKTRMLRSLEREPNMSDEQVMEVCRRALADDKDFNMACKYVDFCLTNETEEDFNGCIEILTQWIENLYDKGDR
jgi:guanylate kinase